ncbi:hypothetical protein TVAG_211720 [Trichomonas vaginalis G3]|uniref:Uncharacterized protein n=1 Tax=Trichomonas vaginalis (strain ATCC PRA-98 / G3) TaxID=412133 RepID=A2G087_TRIV3|nr:hypothetical protein TVAGG3_0735480 [Trichomonas vaginalis G3]EAX89422.1 hypothetical protein TVAG_211720 [Trichomonas vaginalis G3]KAI5511551.1 hypothetical protein TVAGG3_0735480 [Trichomonas vaginalis G3]|eukprot:XP_001302352.1 hypothetical protein [Trichomonas vaginalis G3]
MADYNDYLIAFTQVCRFFNAFAPSTKLFIVPLTSCQQRFDFFELSPTVYKVNEKVMELLNLIYSINVDELPEESLSMYYQLKDQTEFQFGNFIQYLNKYLYWINKEWPGLLKSLDSIAIKYRTYLNLNFIQRFSYKSKEIYPIIKKFCRELRVDFNEFSNGVDEVYCDLLDFGVSVLKTISSVKKLISIVKENRKQQIFQTYNDQDNPKEEFKYLENRSYLKSLQFETFHKRPYSGIPNIF